MRRHTILGLAMTVLLAAMVVACAGAGSSSTSAPSTAVQVPVPSSVFTGRDLCRGVQAPPNSDPDTFDATYAVCDRTASDPRLSGTINLVSYGPEATDPDVGFMWGSGTLTNDNGSWDCKEVLMGSMENGVGWRHMVCVGLGDYVGQIAYLQMTTNDTATSWGFIGWIAKA